MAKVSPYFNLTCSSTSNWAGYVNYTLTDDPANNRTIVDAELWAYKVETSSGGNNPLFAPTITIDGVTYGDDDDKYTTEYKTHAKHLTVSDISVYHNSNGEKTLTISGKVVKEKDPTDYETTLDGKSISGSKTITLTDYITGYTLTYNANGGSGAPSSVKNITSTKISSTVPTRSGYDFLGWSKSSSATSASYVAGNSISLTSNTTLYAVWKKKTYAVTYNANGGSGTTSSQTVDAGSAVTLRSNGFTAPTSKVWTLTLDGNGGHDGSPTFEGNYFNKWRAGSTSGTAYSAGYSYTPSKDITMYAWWGTSYIWGTTTRDPDYAEGYTVTFNPNGGTCDTDFLTSEIITSYDFLGWGNSESNPTSTFKSDVKYSQTSNYKAFAIWSPPITTNGSITLPTPTRNGYEFLGWSTDKFDTNGVTGEYAPDGEGIVLYAIWKPMGNVYIYDDTGGFNQYQVLIYDGSGWNQYIPYIYTESGWEMYSG